jgi:hypothetical protein
VTPTQRAQLIQRLEGGHDLEASAAAAGVRIDEVQSDASLMAECAAAYRVGTARLRSRMLDAALRGGDVHVLERAIRDREAAQRDQFRPTITNADGEPTDLEQLLTNCSAFELLCLEAVLNNDLEGFGRIVTQEAQRLAYATLRELMEPKQPKQPRRPDAPASIDCCEVLDPQMPIPRSKSVVLMAGDWVVRERTPEEQRAEGLWP